MAQQEKVEHYPVKRLDQALKLWEDTCFLLNTQAQIARGLGRTSKIPFEEPVVHFRELRQHILLSHQSDQKFDSNRFLSTSDFLNQELQGLANYPYNLYQWNRFSRKVFSLSSDIQLQLQNTSFEGIRWNDVRFPFDAYAMQLEHPIKFGDGPNCDFILLSKIMPEYGDGLMVITMPKTFDDISFFTEKEKLRIDSLIGRRRWYQANKICLEYTKRQPATLNIPSLYLNRDMLDSSTQDAENYIRYWDALAEETGEEKIPEEEKETRRIYWRNVAQLVVGFSLYLKQLPAGSKHKTPWVKTPGSPDPTVITDEAEVCYITSTHPMAKARINSLSGTGRGGYEMSWHFRRGYWSRKAGEGHIFGAPKIVWHPPQEIRADRKPKGIESLPSGAQIKT